jgi:hypothetical protein
VGIVRINGPKAIYCINERIKAHVFNAREKREIPYVYLRVSHPTYEVAFRYTSCEVE